MPCSAPCGSSCLSHAPRARETLAQPARSAVGMPRFAHCELLGPGSGPVFDLSFEPECATTLRGLYQRYVYPRIRHGAQTKALVVPGVFAPSVPSPPCRAWEHSCANPLNSTGPKCEYQGIAVSRS